jgi:hypothetical protein
MNRFVQIEHRERRRRLIARLQERNQKLHEEIILNEQIIEELIDEPEPEQEEYYVDSVEDTESFEIASVDIIKPPLQRIPYLHSSYKPRAGTGGPELAVQAATVVARERERTKITRVKPPSEFKPAAIKKKGDTPTHKKKNKKDERKEGLEKARAWALDRKKAKRK